MSKRYLILSIFALSVVSAMDAHFLSEKRIMNFTDMFGGAETHKSWQKLSKTSQLNAIYQESKEKHVAIFKHSTSCGISHMVKDQIQNGYDIDENVLSFYYLDLLSYRPISNNVAEKFKIPHQSPQLLLIKDGEVVYHASHHSINLDSIRNHLRAL